VDHCNSELSGFGRKSKKLLGEYAMADINVAACFERELEELHCPYCGKWVCDTDMNIGRIIEPCRECGRRLVIMNMGDVPFVFKDRRKVARIRRKEKKMFKKAFSTTT
jgi:hypothetical protein